MDKRLVGLLCSTIGLFMSIFFRLNMSKIKNVMDIEETDDKNTNRVNEKEKESTHDLDHVHENMVKEDVSMLPENETYSNVGLPSFLELNDLGITKVSACVPAFSSSRFSN